MTFLESDVQFLAKCAKAYPAGAIAANGMAAAGERLFEHGHVWRPSGRPGKLCLYYASVKGRKLTQWWHVATQIDGANNGA